jgi:Ca-activated chloride channel family protein
MEGWKIVAARRAAARIVDTLTGEDGFAVLSFDHVVEWPADLPRALTPATDRSRFRAVEHLARLDARGGTELLSPLRQAAALLGDSERDDRVLVLITDGQVGNEDQILSHLEPVLAGTRVHVVGIDRAVNAGFLGRLAAIGQGRFELVESEDRLDEAMEQIHHRIGAPLVTGLSLEPDGLEVLPGTVTPSRLGAIFAGVPLVVSGRCRGAAGAMTVRGVTPDGTPWRRTATAEVTEDGAAVPIWARSHVRELEDRYVVDGSTDLEERMVATSLRFGVLCRFTAFVAVDSRVVAAGQDPHKVVQPVEPPSGWAAMSPENAAIPAGSYGAPFTLAAFGGPMAVPAADPPGGGTMPVYGAMRSRRAPARESRGGPPPDVLTMARRQLRQELEHLNGQAAAPEDLRARLLSDLRARLDALIVHLGDAGIAEETVAPLVALLADLAPAEAISGEALVRLWVRTVRVLHEFVHDSHPPAPRAFWKRRA